MINDCHTQKSLDHMSCRLSPRTSILPALLLGPDVRSSLTDWPASMPQLILHPACLFFQKKVLIMSHRQPAMLCALSVWMVREESSFLFPHWSFSCRTEPVVRSRCGVAIDGPPSQSSLQTSSNALARALPLVGLSLVTELLRTACPALLPGPPPLPPTLHSQPSSSCDTLTGSL